MNSWPWVADDFASETLASGPWDPDAEVHMHESGARNAGGGGSETAGRHWPQPRPHSSTRGGRKQRQENNFSRQSRSPGEDEDTRGPCPPFILSSPFGSPKPKADCP